MRSITVGHYLDGEPEKHVEGPYFDILPDTMLLLVYMVKPTFEEISDFKYGKAQFGLFQEDGVIFFLSKLGDMNWMDTPFNKHLASKPVDNRRPEAGEGYSVTLALIDALDSKVVALRFLTLNNKFSNTLMDAVDNQPVILDYDLVLGKIYDKYPLSDDMLLKAIMNS